MTDKQHFFAASTVTVNASASDIWSVLEDVRGWINWDQRLEKIEYSGYLFPGAKFKIISKDRTLQNAKFNVVEVDAALTYQTKISLYIISHGHYIERLGKFSKLTFQIESSVHRMDVEDFLKKIWPQIQIGLSISLNNLAGILEA